MIGVECEYLGSTITVQANLTDKMNLIFEKFRAKAQIGNIPLVFLYKANSINGDLQLDAVISNDDKNENKLKIVVNSIDSQPNNNASSNFISEDIICPQCQENCLIKIENCKISFNCKNGHNQENILLNEFKKTQAIDLTKITCDKCKAKKRSETYEHEFYRCLNCKFNLCPLCKGGHDKSHKIINYNQKNYKCEKHYEDFIKYCINCKLNLCLNCYNEHKDHNCVPFETINPDLNKLKEQKEKLNSLIDVMKENIESIKKNLDKVIENLKIYSEIYDKLVKSCEDKKRNYELFKNIDEINKCNIIENLNDIAGNNNNGNKLAKLIDLYNKMSNNELDSSRTLTYENGDKYVGELKNGLKNGKGIYYYVNGNRYEGDWKDDKKEGKGIFYFVNGDRFEGECKNDKANGKGIKYFNNGDKYDGDWKDDTMEGRGILYSSNGSKFVGEFKNNNVEGKQIFYWNDGDIQMGDYRNGSFEGKFITFHANGEVEVHDDW